MLAFILKRLGQSVLVMAVVSAISFSLFNFVGDPVNNMVGQDATREQRIQIREDLGLNDPILTQYFRFMGNALQGDFGLSYRIKRPVDDLIMERLPATLELVFVSAIIALVVGIGLGVYTGIRRRSWLRRIILSTSLGGVSLPTSVPTGGRDPTGHRGSSGPSVAAPRPDPSCRHRPQRRREFGAAGPRGRGSAMGRCPLASSLRRRRASRVTVKGKRLKECA